MVGRNIYELTDAAGKRFGEEIHAVATEGEFNVVEYVWPRPGETEAVPKATYVTKVSGAGLRRRLLQVRAARSCCRRARPGGATTLRDDGQVTWTALLIV